MDLSGDLVVSQAGERLEGPRPERIRSVDAEALPVGVNVASYPVVATLLVDKGGTGA